MRSPHGRKPSCAVVGTVGPCYLAAMKTSHSLRRGLRVGALAVFAAGAIVWTATGAHRGWTQTSVVTLQRDEITGIDYPVRHDRFVAGVEVPLAAAAVAAVLAGASLFRRRTSRTA